MAKKVLIIEDSTLVMKVIRHVIKQELKDLEPIYASSLKEAKQQYEENKADIYAALADLTLPDAPNGEVVDLSLIHISEPTRPY